jgi:hypothetical protein
METEITKNTSGKRKVLFTLSILISAFLAYYSIMSMISPVHKLEEIKDKFTVKPGEKSKVDERIFSDSAYLRLLKDKTFLQSRVAMAETDSIYLTINLSDSTANLEISGVVVNKAKISESKTSKILTKGDENVILSLLATPFNISNSFATIEKEPVLIKMAPKDTSEYKPAIAPDTSITVPVNYLLEMTNGTRIYVYEEERVSHIDRMSFLRFDMKYRLSDTWSSLKSVFTFKVPEYHPYIKIWLPRTDAKIIYRALPRNGQVGIYW